MKLPNIPAIGWVLGNWQLALAAAGALAIYSGAIYFTGRSHGYDSAVAAQSKVAEAARIVTEESAAISAAERAEADALIRGEKEERDDAIETADNPRLALNCKRLQQSGADISQFPACGRYAGGAEADARP